MYVPRSVKRRLWILPAAVLVLSPGWRGELVPVPHEEVLLKAAEFDADEVFGAVRAGSVEGEEWDVQYMGSRVANALALLNLRGLATRLVPPAYAAHVPPGGDLRPQRADAYFRVEAHVRWPWWWPGGGVRWELPAR